MTDNLTLARIRKFCAYQERSAREVEIKLREWKVPANKTGSLIRTLKEEGFLDDARFVRSFIHGKLTINHWGRRKIVYELRGKGIPDNLIGEGIGEIDPDSYMEILSNLIEKKSREIKGGKNLTIREKLINFAAGRGFEFDVIHAALKNLNM